MAVSDAGDPCSQTWTRMWAWESHRRSHDVKKFRVKAVPTLISGGILPGED